MLTKETKLLRLNRRAFRNQYSKTTEEVIKRIAKGQTSHQIADELDLSLKTVATTRGNLTRDMYYPYAFVNDNGNIVGECRF